MVDKFLIWAFVLVLIAGCSRKSLITIDELKVDYDLKISEITIIDQQKNSVGPCEPSVAINPKNADEIIVGSILDRFHHSIDGGKTWKTAKLKSKFGVYGDPVVGIDSKGTFYYAHLSNPENRAYDSDSFLDRIVVQTSKDHGATWNHGTFPPNDHSKDQDKHWFYIDSKSDDILMTWTEFDKYGSSEEDCSSRILFSKSSDGASTWSEALPISSIEGDCEDNDSTTEGAVPTMDKEGNYHVVWAYNDHLYHRVSKDEGKTWNGAEKTIMNQIGGWVIDIPGFGRANGMPILKADNVSVDHGGTLYVNWADQYNGEDNTDIWIIKSTDNGQSWSDRVKVNTDNQVAHQFFTWMDIDQSSGYIYIVFYDRRETEHPLDTDVYLAISKDGGDSFQNIKLNKKSFRPSEKIFMGDYNNVAAHNGVIVPVWTELHDNVLSVRTATVRISDR